MTRLLSEERQRRHLDKLRQELGEINGLLADTDVIEVHATGNGMVWTDRLSVGKEQADFMLSEIQREQIMATVASWHELVINRSSPRLKAELPPDGARFQGMVRPVSAPAFVIRRPFNRILSFEQFVSDGSMTPWQAQQLREAVKNRQRILVDGATLSGKTVLANSVVAEVLKQHGPGLRTLLIEDTYEMTAPPDATNFEHMHTTETTDMRALIQDAMRYSPELFVIGEVRGPEAWDMLNMWMTGHGTSVSTIHADSGIGALQRLGMLVRQAGVEPDKEMIGAVVNLIITMERVGSQHWRVKEMARCEGWDGKQYQLSVLNHTQEVIRYEESVSVHSNNHGGHGINQGSHGLGDCVQRPAL